MKIQLTDCGFIRYIEYPKGQEALKFGEIVCETLNEYYGNPLTPEWQDAGHPLSQKLDVFRQMRVLINKNSVRAKLDPIIRYLPLLESDRKLFKKIFSGRSTLTDLFAPAPTVKFFWDGSTLIQIFDVNKVSELLIFDVAKVLEYDISIFICKHCGRYFIPSRKNERYCEKHRKEGANATKIENLKRDRCRRLRKNIYDLLRARSEATRDDEKHTLAEAEKMAFIQECDLWAEKVKDGLIPESGYYEWLCAQRERYGRYKKRPPKTDGE